MLKVISSPVQFCTNVSGDGKEPKHDGVLSQSKAGSTQKPSQRQQPDVSNGAGSSELVQAQVQSPSHSSKQQLSEVIEEKQPEKQAAAILLDKTAAKESSSHQGIFKIVRMSS